MYVAAELSFNFVLVYESTFILVDGVSVMGVSTVVVGVGGVEVGGIVEAVSGFFCIPRYTAAAATTKARNIIAPTSGTLLLL